MDTTNGSDEGLWGSSNKSDGEFHHGLWDIWMCFPHFRAPQWRNVFKWDIRAGAQDVYSCEKGQKVWPRGLIWVAVSIPKMFCWQAWGGAFTPKSPFEVPKKLHLFMLKGPRKKILPSCSLGFQEYEMDNASNFTRGFTPASNPKRGNEMGFYLC